MGAAKDCVTLSTTRPGSGFQVPRNTVTFSRAIVASLGAETFIRVATAREQFSGNQWSQSGNVRLPVASSLPGANDHEL
jgi:hypothetical protein